MFDLNPTTLVNLYLNASIKIPFEEMGLIERAGFLLHHSTPSTKACPRKALIWALRQGDLDAALRIECHCFDDEDADVDQIIRTADQVRISGSFEVE
jgi:hypothetical protein